jgi:ubiquitin-protein ligase
MYNNSKKRIQKDFTDLVYLIKEKKNLYYMMDPTCDLCNLNNMSKFTILLNGPENTPYANGKFRLLIKMPVEYPDDPPEITFLTKIYHPNIENSDTKLEWKICLDILDTNWKPAYNLIKVIEYIYNLLENPNSNDPLSPDVNSVYKKNYNEFIENAKLWTKTYSVI